jgi:hypothetical protein
MLIELPRLRQEQYSFAAIPREIAERGYRNRKGHIIDSAHIRLLLQRDQPETQSSAAQAGYIDQQFFGFAGERRNPHGPIPLMVSDRA